MRNRTVYLDTNVMISTFEGNDSFLVDRVTSLLDDPNACLVLSMENLVEFSQSRNRGAAIDLVRIATSYPHVWIRPFDELHRETLANFARVNFFKTPALNFSPFFSSFQNFFEDPNIAMTPETYVEFSYGSHSLRDLRLKQKEYAIVVAELQKESTKRLFTKAVDDRMMLKLFKDFLGKELDLAAEYCLKNIVKTYRSCPSLNCERHLSTFQTSSVKRKPTASDSVDLVSSIAAFPFVDMFISFDGYLINGLRYVQKKCPEFRAELYDRARLADTKLKF
jgi:hypothetical protein